MIVGIALAFGSIARADPSPLAQAQAALDVSDYQAAKTALDEALASGANSPDELAEVYRLRGIVAAALGDAAAATDAFAHLFAIKPAAQLAPGTSPKITKPFAIAKDAAQSKGPLQLAVETSVGTEASPPSVTLIVTSDPLAMVVKARATIVVDGTAAPAREAAGHDRITIELPRGQRIELHVAALDERGNHLVELGTTDAIVIVAPPRVVPPPPPPVVESARPVYAAWWLYGGVAVAAAAVGTTFGLEARSATHELTQINGDSSHHTFDEARRVEQRARRDLDVANIGFATAGLFAIAAGVLFATRPHARHAELAPTSVRGGAGLALEVPF